MAEPGVGYSKLVGFSLPLWLESVFCSVEAEINPVSEENNPDLLCHVTSPARPCCFASRPGKPLGEHKPAAGYDLELRPTSEYEDEPLRFTDR
jgi:hypothetical protein